MEVKIAANRRFRLCVRRIMGKARYSHQASFKTEFVDDFDNTRREGDDALIAVLRLPELAEPVPRRSQRKTVLRKLTSLDPASPI